MYDPPASTSQGLGLQGCIRTDLCRAGWKSTLGRQARELSHTPSPDTLSRSQPVVCVGDRKSPTAQRQHSDAPPLQWFPRKRRGLTPPSACSRSGNPDGMASGRGHTPEHSAYYHRAGVSPDDCGLRGIGILLFRDRNPKGGSSVDTASRCLRDTCTGHRTKGAVVG